MIEPKYRWTRELTRYHWFVLIVAALGWLFDCLDQQLFILARPAAMEELIPAKEEMSAAEAKQLSLDRSAAGNWATTLFIAGWATGGLIFGMLGDRIGRAKTMVLTILMYSLFTGLSSLSTGVWDFCFYRFLTGLGVGGEFAVGVALVAEVMPDRARPYALSLLQALSAFGNLSAAFINLGLGMAAEEGMVHSPWRIMFLIGAAPALLTLIIRRKLREPERWEKQSHDGAVAKQMGSYRELFTDPRWRRHALFGLMLACSGVIGLWAVGFFTPDLIRKVQTQGITLGVYEEEAEIAKAAGDTPRSLIAEELAANVRAGKSTDDLSNEAQELRKALRPTITGRLTKWQSISSIMFNIGAFLGVYSFGVVSERIGRKPTFAIALIAALVSTVVVFWTLKDPWQVIVLVPIMGFCQLSLFGGFAVYFPELFPTRLRSTGTSFCYNVGRFIAALGPLAKTQLEEAFSNTPEPLRYAGMSMCVVFLIGLVALPFLPETKGQPLPE
jgi:MFS family permease